MRQTAGPGHCAFAEDVLDEFGNRKRRSDARTVPENALTTAPESGPDVLRRGTVPGAQAFSQIRLLEDGAKGTKKRDEHDVSAKIGMWKDDKMVLREAGNSLSPGKKDFLIFLISEKE
jgi:hypothetical protein